MRCTTLWALLMGVMLYLVMGALVFRTLEAPKESSAYEDLLKTKQNFLGNNSCVTELDFQELVKVRHRSTLYLLYFYFHPLPLPAYCRVVSQLICVAQLTVFKREASPPQGVVSAVDAGLDVSSLPANFTSRWDVASAFFFCGTIITTIGRRQDSGKSSCRKGVIKN